MLIIAFKYIYIYICQQNTGHQVARVTKFCTLVHISWISCGVFALYHPSGAYNFEVVPIFLESCVLLIYIYIYVCVCVCVCNLDIGILA
jgi:hypothetical protein